MKKVLLFAFAATLMFVSCKKGEQDPGLSIKSRKARMTNDWVLKTVVSESSYEGTVRTSTTEVVDGIATTTDSDGDISVDTTTRTLSMLGDGTYKLDYTWGTRTSKYEGVWTFAGGTGDVKSKSQILLQTTKYIDADGDGDNYAVDTDWDDTWDLVKVASSEMIWETTDNDYDGDYDKVTYTWTKAK